MQEFSFAPDLWCRVQYRADGAERLIKGANGARYVNGKNPRAWKPSMHMPRAFCRQELLIEHIGTERVQEIGDDDAIFEGFGCEDEYRAVWDAIYAARGQGWDANPWVWAIYFGKVNQKAQA